MTEPGWITVEIRQALGSTPRDQGTMMWVSAERIEGTIGGGALEFRAIDRARDMLAQGETSATLDLPLGPALNQCCGGFVSLALSAGKRPPPQEMHQPLVIYGGGHVGTALAAALAPLPFAVTWLDERDSTPADQASLTEHARRCQSGALHYVMTHDHQLDLAIVSTLLARDVETVPFIGMIGSDTKITRFRSQLKAAGFDEQSQRRLITPIGIAGIRGKEPAVIAAAVAAEALLLATRLAAQAEPASVGSGPDS
jgi:xanthine dehydrogenase accessory factor